jgi:hypothetical protein
MKLLAVNGRRFNGDRLRDAVKTTRDGKEKLRLLLENDDFFHTYALDYAAGARYPHLERDTSKTDLIGEIFRPRNGKGAR